MSQTRRTFAKTLGCLASAAWGASQAAESEPAAQPLIAPSFLVSQEELDLNFRHPDGQRRLTFAKHRSDPQRWRADCLSKLRELCDISVPKPSPARRLRSCSVDGVNLTALAMDVERGLSVPAYLLEPRRDAGKRLVMAVHGHGKVEGVIGAQDDYHHRFGFELAREGFTVLAPVLRGFGVLRNLAWSTRGQRCLDYWDWDRGHQFSLVTDGFLRGCTLIGQTVEDLLRWEDWFCKSTESETLDVAGISYGGDLAVLYPVFSNRIRRIFASGTMGSFSDIFGRCYNAPAHCIPQILQWMDRSDIAGLNAPRPMALHYGESDVPGPDNNSAAYNETVEPAWSELREIYQAFGAAKALQLIVTPGRGHEMDNVALSKFLA
ncbi:MAG: alpha/beta hydrolase family protein [Verrucomicrobiia bacterium]